MNSLIERPRLSEYHWKLWIYECAQPLVGAKGYPRQSTIYTPPRRGDTSELPPTPPTEDDFVLSRQLAKGVEALGLIDAQGKELLRQWYGAYPYAPTNRKDRLRRMGIDYMSGRHLVESKRGFVEGWVFCFREFHYA